MLSTGVVLKSHLSLFHLSQQHSFANFSVTVSSNEAQHILI
jgi:hypothetical protein